MVGGVMCLGAIGWNPRCSSGVYHSASPGGQHYETGFESVRIVFVSSGWNTTTSVLLADDFAG